MWNTRQMTLHVHWALHLGWGLLLAISGPSGIPEGWGSWVQAMRRCVVQKVFLKNYKFDQNCSTFYYHNT